MGEKAWYTIKSSPKAVDGFPVFDVTKFSNEMEYLVTYEITVGKLQLQCDCIAGLQQKHCRHKQTYLNFKERGYIDKGWFYCFDTKFWKPPQHPAE